MVATFIHVGRDGNRSVLIPPLLELDSTATLKEQGVHKTVFVHSVHAYQSNYNGSTGTACSMRGELTNRCAFDQRFCLVRRTFMAGLKVIRFQLCIGTSSDLSARAGKPQ